MKITPLTSLQNPVIKYLKKLRESSSFRDTEHCFIVEGKKEISLAQSNGYLLKSIFYPSKAFNIESAQNELGKTQQGAVQVFTVTTELMEKIAVRDQKESLIAVFSLPQKSLKVEHSFLGESTIPKLILVIEAIEKPGNIGALFRTADALGIDGIIVCTPKCDILSPNSIRSSLGTVFSVPWVYADIDDLKGFLKHFQLSLVAASLDPKSKFITESNLAHPVAIAVGSEAWGLSPELMQLADQHVKIPMRGVADSLNVSVATAILLYETRRQQQ